MPEHAVKIIVNPNANLGRAWRTASDLAPIVEEYGGADWSGTVYPMHAAELARQASEAGYKIVIAAGGDGTTHEVLNGLMRVSPERRARLGIVPLGSGNDFAHAVGIERDPVLALRKALNGSSRRIDIGCLTDTQGRQKFWGNAVGIGFDATVTIRSRRFTRNQGFLIYFIAVLQTILLNHDAPRLRVSTDQEQWEDNLLMLVLCNGQREGGGFLVAPEAKMDDGKLDYTGIRRVSRPMMLRLLPEVMKGTHGRFPQVRMGKFHEMSLSSDRPLVIHVDGEIYAGLGVDKRQLSFEILPGALEVVH